MAEVFNFPFVAPGFSEASDAVTSEPPTLRAIVNGRIRKRGRISKRFGLTDASRAVVTGCTALAGRPNLICSYRGRQVLVTNGIVYHRGSASQSWIESDRIPAYTPVRAEEIARNDVTGPLSHPSVARISGYLLVAYQTSTPTVVVNVYTEAGEKVATFTLSGSEPKVLPATSLTFAVFYRSGTTINVRSYTPSTLTIGAAVAVGTMHSSTDYYDACKHASTQYGLGLGLTYRSAATTMTVKLLDASTFATSVSVTHACTDNRNRPAIFGADGEPMYVAWLETGAGQTVKAISYAQDLTAPTAIASLDTTGGMSLAPVIGRVDASNVRIVWGGLVGSPSYYLTKHCNFSSSGVAGSASEIINYLHCSEPFDSDTNGFRIWMAQTSNYGLARYVLVHVRNNAGIYEPLPDLHTDAGWAIAEGDFRDTLHTVPASGTDTEGMVAVPRRIRGLPGSGLYNTGVILLRYASAAATGLPRNAHRQGIEAQGVLHITGGELIEHFGSARDEQGISGSPTLVGGIENNFLQPPMLYSATAVAGGSLTSGAVYQFCCTFETLDSAGRRTRSLPSNTVTVSPAAGNLTASFHVLQCGVSGRRLKHLTQTTSIAVYRTEANGSIFYRSSSDTVATAGLAFAGGGVVTITDGQADTAINFKETLYTHREAGNYPCPSHRFAVRGGGYLFVGGLWNPNEVRCTKPFVLDEPSQFVEDDAFRLLAPEPVTGLGWLDDTIVIFTERGIYIPSSGAGPDRQGAGAFGELRQLPSDVGCSDWRSVQEVPDGLMFQSTRGFHLLPRGFGAPVFQADVSELATSSSVYCFGTARSRGRIGQVESSLVYLMGNGEEPFSSGGFGGGVGLVYDMNTGAWVSQDLYETSFCAIGTWGDSLALAPIDLASLVWESTVWGSPASFTQTKVKTGQIHPFGFGGYGRVLEIKVQGEFRSSAKLGINLKVDGLHAESLAPVLVNAVNGTNLGAGDKWYFRWKPRRTQGNSFEIEIYDAVNGSSVNEGLAFHGVSLVVEPELGTKPLGAGNRG